MSVRDRLPALLVLVAGLALVAALVLAPGPADDASLVREVAGAPDASADAPSELAPPPRAPEPDDAPALDARTALPGTTVDEPLVHVRAVVTDAATGEALPAFLVAVSTADMNRDATTDARGEIAFPVPASPPSEGRIGFALVDHRGLDRHARSPTFRMDLAGLARLAREGGEPLPLVAHVGPTLFLELELPPGLAAVDLEAELTHHRPYARRLGGQDLLAPVRAPHPATLHPALPWVRFGAPPGWRGGTGWVELRSADGRWHGGAWVEPVRGTVAEPVAIAFQPAAWLVARTATALGTTASWVPFHLVERLPPGAHRAPRTHRAHSDEQGRLVVEFVEPGDYVLRLTGRDWGPLERPVTIEVGANDLGTLLVEPRAVVGDVRGTIESASGTYDGAGACHVSLSRVPFDHDAPPYDHGIDFEEDADGRLVAAFELTDVTEGEWFLYVHCHDGFEHPGSLRTVTAPVDDLRIVLDAPSMVVEVDLRDALTGEPLDDAETDWSCGDVFDVAEGAHVAIDGLPADPRRFEFLATAPGYRALRSVDAASSYEPPGAGAPGRLRFECRMMRGFAALVVARELSSGDRVAGAHVWFDGVLAGETDAAGEVWYESATRPERLRVECAGRRWVPSERVDPRAGRFGDGPRIDVTLERER